MSGTEAFNSRVANVFGNLVAEGGPSPPTWAVHVDGTFRSGVAAADFNSEDEDAAPAALSGADSEDEQAAYDCKASYSYRMAMEQEEDFDAFDKLASGGLHSRTLPDCMPAGSTEVLEDNPYDRMCRSKLTGTTSPQAEPHDEEMADAAAVAAAGSPMEAGPPESTTQLPPPPPPPSAATSAAAAPTARAAESTRAPSSTAAAAAAMPQLPLQPPGADMAGMDAAAKAAMNAAYIKGLEDHLQLLQSYEEQQKMQEPKQQQQQQQRDAAACGGGAAKRAKRVSFADDEEPGSTHAGSKEGGSSREDPSTSSRQALTGGGGRRYARGGGRRRPHAVPGHVLHPGKYTVYTLDEPLFVGGGDKMGDADSDNLQAAEATRIAAKAMRNNTGRDGIAGAAAGAGGEYLTPEEAALQQQQSQQQWQAGAAGQGAIQFRPSGKHSQRKSTSFTAAVAPAANMRGAVKGAFVEEDMEDSMQEDAAHELDATATRPGAAATGAELCSAATVAMGSGTSGAQQLQDPGRGSMRRRQFRRPN